MNALLRATGFTFAVVLLAMSIGWATYLSWRELRQLNRGFTAIQSDGFHKSEHVEATVRALNAILLRFDQHQGPGDRSLFQEESDKLKQWLTAHKASVTPS